MANDNIFSGLKVVDFASFIAGPGAAVILSDFGADVIKVESPAGDLWRIGHQIPPQPQAKDAYPWHLANRNKRGITLDLKSPSAQQVLEKLVKWADVFIVNTPHPARKRLKLEYDDVVRWNPRLIYADVTGFGEKGPDAELPGFDITSYWARSGLLSMTRDAGAPPTWPVAGSGDNATAVGIYSAIVTALYRRERTGKGAYVTTSLLAEGVWSASVVDPGGALRREVLRPARSQESRECGDECVSGRRRHLVRSSCYSGQAGAGGESDRPPGSPDRSAVLRSGEAGREHAAAHRHSRRSLRRATDGALVRSLQWSARHVRCRARAARSDQRSAAALRTISSFRSKVPAAS